MKSEEFIESIVKYVRNSAVEDTVSIMQKPQGRKPRQKNVELSEWYNNQSERDKDMIEKALYEAVDASLFGLFAVIDGVRTIEGSTSKGTFKLYFEKEDGKKLLNDEDNEFLHDIYNAITNPTD